MATLNVLDFGAVADNGYTDNTGAFQNALNTCESDGGGVVVAPSYGNNSRFGFQGGLTVPAGVQLKGELEGPADQDLTGTVLEIHNTSVPFLSDTGRDLAGGATISDLAFWYPNQTTGSTDPINYPSTITFQSLVKVRRCYFHNSYDAIRINAGRSVVEDCNIGSFSSAVAVDSSYDTVRLHNVHVWPFYEVAYPTEADTWGYSHGIGFQFMRADDVQMTNCYVFGKWVGMYLTDSPNSQPGGLRGSTGMASNFGTDACQHGIMASSTQGNGWNFNNFYNAASAPSNVNGGKAVAGVTFIPGGTSKPTIQVTGGWEGGNYSVGPVFDYNGATYFFRASQWLGYQ